MWRIMASQGKKLVRLHLNQQARQRWCVPVTLAMRERHIYRRMTVQAGLGRSVRTY
jgi:hypothetical protein